MNWAMNGHGIYLWPSYGLVLTGLAIFLLKGWYQMATLKRRLRKELESK